jgi:hypothetical protein
MRLLAFIALLPLAACDIAPKGPARPASSHTPTAAAWPFAPARIEVHPLTRLIPAHDAPGRVEAHIVMRDQFGDEVKGLGSLVIELYADQGPGVASSRQLSVWTFDLADLAANDRAYDNITRTYRLDLADVPLGVSEQGLLRLRATLTTTSSRAFTDERRITITSPRAAEPSP